MERIYKALEYVKKKMKSKQFKDLSPESAEYDWALDDLQSEAVEKYKLSDDETHCFFDLIAEEFP